MLEEVEKIEEEIIPGVNAPSEKESYFSMEEAGQTPELSVEDKASLMKEVAEMNLQRISWRDYALNLLNTAAEPARSNWREKLVTSIIHWSYGKGGSFNEGNLEGLEVLTELPSGLTEEIVDDSYERGTWYFNGRLAGSKKRKMLLGHYSQQSLAKEGNIMWEWMMNNWFEEWEGKPIWKIVQDSDHLRKTFEFAQRSGGEVLFNDEILTYVLEKDAHEERPAFWTNVSDDVFTNGIPSDKYKNDYKTIMPEQYPVESYFIEESFEGDFWWNKFLRPEERSSNPEITEPMKRLFKNVQDVADKYMKEDLSNSPSWKRMVVVILQNDIDGKYMGFSKSSVAELSRAEAMAAFSKNEKEADQAKASIGILKKKVEKEESEADDFK